MCVVDPVMTSYKPIVQQQTVLDGNQCEDEIR